MRVEPRWPASTMLPNPLGVGVDRTNNLYISNGANDRCRFSRDGEHTTAPANDQRRLKSWPERPTHQNRHPDGANGLANPIGISFDDALRQHIAAANQEPQLARDPGIAPVAGDGDGGPATMRMRTVLSGTNDLIRHTVRMRASPTSCRRYMRISPVASDSASGVSPPVPSSNRSPAYAPPVFTHPGDIGDKFAGRSEHATFTGRFHAATA